MIPERKSNAIFSGHYRKKDQLAQENSSLTPGFTVPNPSEVVAPKPAQHGAKWDGIRGNEVESPFFVNAYNALENKEHEGNKRHREAHSVNCLNSCNRMERDCRWFLQVYAEQRVRAFPKTVRH